MVDFINRWSKRFGKIWLIGVIGFIAFLYNDSVNESPRKYTMSPVYSTINLFLPFSLQKSLSPPMGGSTYIGACKVKTKFPFERFVIGYRHYKGNGLYWFDDDYSLVYETCKTGDKRVALGILSFIFLPFIGLNYVLPWISRLLVGAGKSYKLVTKEAKVNTEKNYLKAYKEVESGKIKSPELWAKAFAETEGDEVKQKALYVELRTKQLDEK